MGGENPRLSAEVPPSIREGELHPVVAPIAVAEAGSSTSEYKVAIFTGIHDILVIGVAVGMNALGFHPSPEIQQLIEVEVGTVSTLATGYIVSRGIRKNGTTA